MKYQHIINGNLLFETDNVSEFFMYLLKFPQERNSTLFDLLDKTNGYILNMASN
jgi:hypothetical protein